MPNTDAVTLAAYLVLSNITKPKGCDLWVSPRGGRGDIEQLYEEDGKPYVVLSIKDLDDDALRALTLLQRDTETPGAEAFYRSEFMRAVEAAYSAGLNNKACPAFEHTWPAAAALQSAFDRVITAAYDAGERRLGP